MDQKGKADGAESGSLYVLQEDVDLVLVVDQDTQHNDATKDDDVLLDGSEPGSLEGQGLEGGRTEESGWGYDDGHW